MLHAFVRLTTGVELGLAAITAFIGAGFASLVNVGMKGNLGLAVTGFIIAATVALIAYTVAGVWRRYQRLRHGLCGHPVCHGTVSSTDDLPDHLVECSNCKRVWPNLVEEPQKAPAT